MSTGSLPCEPRGGPIGRCRRGDPDGAEQAISAVISTTCSMKASS